MSYSDGLPIISEEELREHIEDDNFSRRYGNPVVVRSKGRKDIVCMAWEYYQVLKEQLDKAINDLQYEESAEQYDAKMATKIK